MIHLLRHLRDVHKWTKEKAKKATSTFGLRKSFQPKLNENLYSNLLRKLYRKRKEKIITDIEGVL